MTAKISVAIATYNGSKYIAEQLESLNNQTITPFEIVVCDDRSNDNTYEIVKEFAKKAKFPVKIFINDTNVGPIENFFIAANKCSGDWISFCDQDDVWFPNKLSSVVDAINRESKVNIVLQHALLADENLKSTGKTFPFSKCTGYFNSNELDLFFEWHGFLQTIRADIFHMFEYRKRPLNKYRSFQNQSHDQWTCMIANAIGGVMILGETSAFYRRHSQTVTGNYLSKKKSILNRYKSKPIASEMQWEAIVCDSYASYIYSQNKRASSSKFSYELENSIKSYRMRADILSLRSTLYTEGSIFKCFRIMFNLYQLGGYAIKSRTTLGIKGFARDFLYIVEKLSA